MTDTSSVYGRSDEETTDSEQGLVELLGGILALTVAPTVVGVPVVLAATAISDVNIRSWTPFDKASAAWNDISDFFTSVNTNASELAAEVRQNWQSAGADAFTGFMQQIDKQIGAIAAAAQGCRDMCDDMKLTLVANLATFAGATIASIIGAVLALNTGEAAPAVQLTLVTVWAGLILAILAALVSSTEQIFSVTKDISDAWSDLTDVFATKAGKIQTDSLHLPSLTSGRISDPKLWVKQPQPD
jgi:alkylhydroperoxidase/carboxymuconolactone decarboxylase family protein YurZ